MKHDLTQHDVLNHGYLKNINHIKVIFFNYLNSDPVSIKMCIKIVENVYRLCNENVCPSKSIDYFINVYKTKVNMHIYVHTNMHVLKA